MKVIKTNNFLILAGLFYALAFVVPGEAEEIEKINVIGSHIKRTDVEGPSPVLVIDREQIDMSGHNSLSDVLRDLPVASFGSTSEHSLNQPSSSTATSLRGMSSSEILFLMNGRRISPYGGSTIVDLSSIPLSVIEKIEILKDGASALYGSDALGGVINIITKKSGAGAQVNIQGSLVQREEGNSLSGFASFVDFWNWNDDNEDNSWAGKGDKLNIDASYGGNINDINYLVGAQIRFNTPLYLRDRYFGRLGKAKGGSSFGSPGSWSQDNGGTWTAATDCPEENKKPNGICGFDWSSYMQFTPQVLQSSAFLYADKEVNDILLSTQATYSHTRSHSTIAPAPDSFSAPDKPGGKDYRIPVESAQKIGLSANQPVTLLYRLVEEEGSGPRQTILNSHSYQMQFSAVTPVMDTMELAGHLNISGSYYSSISKNYANKEILFDMINEGTFNPFLTSGNKSDISKASYEPTQDTFSNIISFEPQISGELAEVGEHLFMFAVGGLGSWQYYVQENDKITKSRKQWGGGVSVDGEGDRWYGGLYGELSLFSFETTELQLALRSDYYSDYGLTKQTIPFTDPDDDYAMPFSPRVALSVQPANEIKFRASWGMGFKAPSLASLNTDESISHPASRDYALCNDEYIKIAENKDKDECKPIQYKVYNRSNKQLKPEFSQSLNVGFILEPIDWFSLSLDYYRNSQSDIATSLGIRDLTKYEDQYGIEELKKTNNDIVRKGDGTIDYIVSVPANLSHYKAHGIDLEAMWTAPLEGGWDFGLKLEHSHLLYVERQALKGSEVENPVPWPEWLESMLGLENAQKDRKNSLPWYTAPRWRNRAIFSLMSKDIGHKFDLIVHNIPSQLRKREDTKKTIDKIEEEGSEAEGDSTFGFIDYYWQIDLRGSFQITDNSRLIVGVQNILGLDRPERKKPKEGGDFYPPNNSAGIYLDSNLYSLRGRSIDLRYTYNF